MAYSWLTYAQMRTALQRRLGESTPTYWSDTELGRLCKEALRTWQAYSLYWRDRCVFNTTSGTFFYKLPTTTGVGTSPDDLLGHTLKDQDILQDVQFATLEPVSATDWIGSEMFTLAQISDSISRRRDQFLLETGLVVTYRTMNLPSPPASGRVALADTVIDVRRAAFKDVTNVYTHLWRTDEFSLNTLIPNWSYTAAVPSQFSVILVPPVTLQLAPIPIDIGTLDLLTVETGSAANPAAGVLLGIPDDLAWVIKYGVLSDLLGADGLARDPARAQYCESRWQEGLALAKLVFTYVLNGEIQGVPLILASLMSADTLNPNWQNTSGQPTSVHLVGDMLALAPVPDAGPYSVTLDVVRKAPLPSLDGDFIQLGREEMDAVLDYAVHLAAFKMAGTEFAATQIHYQRFVRLAAQHNMRLRAQATFFEALHSLVQREERSRPRRQMREEEAA